MIKAYTPKLLRCIYLLFSLKAYTNNCSGYQTTCFEMASVSFNFGIVEVNKSTEEPQDFQTKRKDDVISFFFFSKRRSKVAWGADVGQIMQHNKKNSAVPLRLWTFCTFSGRFKYLHNVEFIGGQTCFSSSRWPSSPTVHTSIHVWVVIACYYTDLVGLCWARNNQIYHKMIIGKRKKSGIWKSNKRTNRC